MSEPLTPLIPGIPLGTREENIRWAIKLLETFTEHGSRGGYASGCRCDWCKEANRQYERTWTAKSGKTRAQRKRENRESFVNSLRDEDL